MKNIKFITNIKNFFRSILFFKKVTFVDISLASLLCLSIYFQYFSFKFIYESSKVVLGLAYPIFIIFIWIWMRSQIDRGNLLSSASIMFAVFIFLFSFAYNDDSKIKLISGISNYNCVVAKHISGLTNKPDLATNFTLNHFIYQPYFDNTNFILQKLGTTTGGKLLASAYMAQAANSLINLVWGLNIQGDNSSGYFPVESVRMYNAQLISIASSTNNTFCDELF